MERSFVSIGELARREAESYKDLPLMKRFLSKPAFSGKMFVIAGTEDRTVLEDDELGMSLYSSVSAAHLRFLGRIFFSEPMMRLLQKIYGEDDFDAKIIRETKLNRDIRRGKVQAILYDSRGKARRQRYSK